MKTLTARFDFANSVHHLGAGNNFAKHRVAPTTASGGRVVKEVVVFYIDEGRFRRPSMRNVDSLHQRNVAGTLCDGFYDVRWNNLFPI